METHKEYVPMKPLSSSVDAFIEKGYTEDYRVTDQGLQAIKTGIIYQPEAIKVADFHRFEGPSDPADESILYAIETCDGSKGTLVDSYGPSADTKVTEFMKKVEDIIKRIKPQ